jgi:phage shock protein PspC (stress-responsive transcriptional regulator)
LVDDEIFEDEPIREQRSRKTSPSKKLFRDRDNSYIAGVASGLAYYLGIDSIWIRLLWILLALGSGGTFILIYILFWVLVPEAVSTSEKLIMTGEAVNISNIEKKIKDGIVTVTDAVKSVDFEKHGNQLKEGFDNVTDSISGAAKQVKGSNIKSSSRNFFDTLGDIIMFFFKVFAKFIGVILIITGAATLIALIIGLFSVGVADIIHLPGVDFAEAANATNTPFWVISLLLLFAVGIPFFFLFYLGIKILISNLKSIGSVAKFSLFGLWLISVIALSIIGVKQGMSYKERSSFVKNETLNSLTVKDTIYIRMVGNDSFSDEYRRRYGYKQIINDLDEEVYISRGVRLIVKSTNDSVAKLKIDKSARGFDFLKAKQRAERIDYSYEIIGNELLLNNYFSIDKQDIIKDQEVKLTLYLPVSSTLFADENTYYYHRNDSRYNDILDNGMEEQYLKVFRNELQCLDCDDSRFNKNLDEEESGLRIDDDGLEINSKSLDLKIDDDGLKAKSKSVKVIIDENGIEITTDKDNDN